ncbi:hypothetical protein B0H17DRAFT_1139537 [Mycena rosella]|uniref:Uncharacterized protein n=1 Tax=Mycena rosella TaxID=1033263 RepID=A0AAD7G8M7_MYCRO|nr:hypothetical protein B0H17DRAFT_1139537 [Mycena rosella]
MCEKSVKFFTSFFTEKLEIFNHLPDHATAITPSRSFTDVVTSSGANNATVFVVESAGNSMWIKLPDADSLWEALFDRKSPIFGRDVKPDADVSRRLRCEETWKNNFELETFDGRGSKEAPEKKHDLSAERPSETLWTAL